MLVITHNAEEQLFKDLKALWEKNPAYRCLQLKLAQHDLDWTEHLSLIVTTLRTYLNDNAVQAYLCHDHDVFFITRTLTQKRLDHFLSQALPKLTHASIPPEAASLFEVGVDWPHLRALCEKKLEMLKHSAQQQHSVEPPAIETLIDRASVEAFNEDLVRSLSQRRAARKEPAILVVEDDLFSQKLVHNTLKDHYRVSMTAEGRNAMIEYAKLAPDVLFLDIGLPDIDGHTVLKQIFKIDPDAYVVMFSGNGDKENVLKAVNTGAKGFVGKPFTRQKLFEYIEKSPFIQSKEAQGVLA